ncbi:MAG: hypothetical protein K2X46_17360 [Roseomonas sp.]|nr:hypothetical protein [Roseomonas sp.]
MSATAAPNPDDREPWHLDKRVPIALILAVAVQTAGMVWWAGQLSARVDQHAAMIADLRLADTAQMIDSRRTSDALARMDERLKAQTDILNDIKNAIARQGR